MATHKKRPAIQLTDTLFLTDNLELIRIGTTKQGKIKHEVMGYYSSLKPAVMRAVNITVSQGTTSGRIRDAVDLLNEIDAWYDKLLDLAGELDALRKES